MVCFLRFSNSNNIHKNQSFVTAAPLLNEEKRNVEAEGSNASRSNKVICENEEEVTYLQVHLSKLDHFL